MTGLPLLPRLIWDAPVRRVEKMGIVLGSDGREGRANKTSEDATARGKPPSDPAFDGWLTHHLSRLYDPVIQEPIPEELLKLLKERLG
jgi:hypothetical protein